MGGALYGFRVIRVEPGSPLEEAGLQSYLDFLLSANGVRLVSEDRLAAIVSKSVDCPVLLRVFNVLTRKTREATVVPRQWGGPGLLGGSVRFEEWSGEEDLGVRVLGTQPNSPAAVCGLQPDCDFILGSEEVTITCADQLSALALKSEGSLPLYVFNAEQRIVRRVVLTLLADSPLGLDVGQGALHSLERVLSRNLSSSQPTESMKEKAKVEPSNSASLSALFKDANTLEEEIVMTQSEAPSKSPSAIPSDIEVPASKPPPAMPSDLDVPASKPPPAKLSDVEVPVAKPESQRAARPKVDYVPARVPLQLPALKDPFQTAS